jgi:hypothetical protein
VPYIVTAIAAGIVLALIAGIVIGTVSAAFQPRAPLAIDLR